MGKLKQNLPFSPGISGAAAPRRGLTALSPEYFIAEFRLATAFWAPAGGLAEYAASSINSRRHESNSRHRREHHFCTFTLPHILPGIVAANRSPISDKSRRPPQTSSYVLGLYRVLEVLTFRFPEVLFESCGGGGGRFDAGMLYYTPQIWGSDTTDAIERLSIQYGASLGFPVSCIGSHVAAVPSHQTGRITPLNTRASVSMFGAFGYELDPGSLSGEEKAAIRAQITFYKEHYDLIHHGDYYRLTAPDHPNCTVWEAVAPDGGTALVTAVYRHVFPNPIPVRVKIQGLKDNLWYEVSDGNSDYQVTGASLKQCGLVIPAAKEEYQAWQILVKSGGTCDENEF